ncbi:MAG: 50S ribosomal protein L29 [candidate division WOR-3 bacterium]|uniref:Large ribosomal subunit protein uL29 n=1 Tax=candidate division WOR-3 bacterium TaxID=2052148 RepID=A0A7C3EUC1_UNCW3|nr:50S ribosomal protein L29 [candidate division WOR-3 bacterium]
MKASELRELGREGIRRRLAELEDELLKLKLRRATEELPNPLRLRVLRREIARCHTVLRELELKESEGRNA